MSNSLWYFWWVFVWNPLCSNKRRRRLRAPNSTVKWRDDLCVGTWPSDPKSFHLSIPWRVLWAYLSRPICKINVRMNIAAVCLYRQACFRLIWEGSMDWNFYCNYLVTILSFTFKIMLELPGKIVIYQFNTFLGYDFY